MLKRNEKRKRMLIVIHGWTNKQVLIVIHSQKKRTLIVIHFNPSRSFFYRELLLAV